MKKLTNTKVSIDMASEDESNRQQADSSSDNPSGQGHFECNICLDIAREAVVSLCGHLFWLGRVLLSL